MFLATNGIVASRGINPLWTGLLTYHTADNTPNDALGVANGTLTNGATYATGKINNGFSLDGVNDYVSLGVVSAYNFGTGSFTISCWAYLTSDTYFKALLGIGGYSDTVNGFTIYVKPTQKVEVWRRVDSGGTYTTIGSTADNSFTLNAWHHVVLRRNSGTIDIFIDNTKTNIATGATYSLGSATGTSLIGDNGFSLPMPGKIDEIGVWGRDLSDSEVTELYNSGSGKQYPN